MFQIKKYNKNLKSIELIIEACPEFCISLRNICLSKVPILAIDEINIIRNDTLIDDYQLKRRLELIPILSINLCEHDLDKNCYKCKIELTISIIGKNKVYSSDIQPNNYIPLDQNKTIICKQNLNQGLHIKMITKKGIGAIDSKWNPSIINKYTYDNETKLCEFNIESVGQMNVNEIFLNAIKIYKNQFKIILNELKKDEF